MAWYNNIINKVNTNYRGCNIKLTHNNTDINFTNVNVFYDNDKKLVVFDKSYNLLNHFTLTDNSFLNIQNNKDN